MNMPMVTNRRTIRRGDWLWTHYAAEGWIPSVRIDSVFTARECARAVRLEPGKHLIVRYGRAGRGLHGGCVLR